jgi:hypothetical protein
VDSDDISWNHHPLAAGLQSHARANMALGIELIE